MTAPILIRSIYRRQHLCVGLPGPLGQFFAEEQILRAARSIENNEPSEFGAASQYAIDGRPQRSESDASRHDDDISSMRGVDWPTASKRPSHTDRRSRPSS